MFVFLLTSIIISAVGVASNDIQTIEDIIQNANKYLKENNVTVLSLSDIELLSNDSIKMRMGTLEGLDTMQVLGEPIVKKKKNKDNSTTYFFFVKFGLKELSFHYDFVSTYPVASKGEIWLVPQDNLMQAAGILVLGDNICDVRLYSVEIEESGPITIYLFPKDIPGSAKLTKVIRELIGSKLFEVTNAAFEAETLYPGFQAWFSDFVCVQLKPKKLFDFIK